VIDAEARLREVHARTVRRIAELGAEFDAIIASSDSANLDDEHDPEGATVGFERAQVSALLEQASTQLNEINAAAERRGSATTECARCAECSFPTPDSPRSRRRVGV